MFACVCMYVYAYVHVHVSTYKVWDISFHPFLMGVMRKNGGGANTIIVGDTRAFFDLPNSW